MSTDATLDPAGAHADPMTTTAERDTGTCTYSLWVTDDVAGLDKPAAAREWEEQIRERGFEPTPEPVRFFDLNGSVYVVGRVRPSELTGIMNLPGVQNHTA